jgi:hypothetical protein
MGIWDIELRHIVDVDGQLLAIDADVIDTTSLLEKANRPADRELWQIHAGERFLVSPKQLFRLPKDRVLFFETSATADCSILPRLAA